MLPGMPSRILKRHLILRIGFGSVGKNTTYTPCFLCCENLGMLMGDLWTIFGFFGCCGNILCGLLLEGSWRKEFWGVLWLFLLFFVPFKYSRFMGDKGVFMVRICTLKELLLFSFFFKWTLWSWWSNRNMYICNLKSVQVLFELTNLMMLLFWVSIGQHAWTFELSDYLMVKFDNALWIDDKSCGRQKLSNLEEIINKLFCEAR